MTDCSAPDSCRLDALLQTFEDFKLLGERLNLEQIRSWIMIAAPLLREETKVPLGIVSARPGTAEVDDGGQVLLLSECRRSFSHYSPDLAIEKYGGQLDRVAWDHPGIQAIEPTGIEVMPRALFNDHMVVDTVALPFSKRAVGDLEHADRC